jgi:HEAT repeat protein
MDTAVTKSLQEKRVQQHLRRIEEIEADISESEDPVGELLMWARDGASEVRGQSYRALIDFWDDARVLPFLERTLENEQESDARGLVCIGLGRFLDAASDEGVLEADYQPDAYTPEVLQDVVLVNRIYTRIFHLASQDSTELEVRRRALEALGSFAYRPEVAALIEDMYESKEDTAQVSAIFAMGRSGLKKYRKVLMKHLEDSRSSVQFEAIQAVEWWELRAALPYLRRIISEPNNPNRGFALMAYYQCRAPVEKLRELLREVQARLPDPVFEEVLPEIQEQIHDDMEVGTLDEEGFEGIFPRGDDPPTKLK